MQKLPGAVAAGRCVTARSEPWLVVAHESFVDCVLVTMRGAGSANAGRTTRLLVPFDRITPIQSPTRIVARSRITVLRQAARAIASGCEWLELWTQPASGTELLPWQLDPALAALRGAMRLLLSDGVGLGKTVQAGLIVSELRLRGLATRALILTPASLRHQWQQELQQRLRLNPVVIDHDELLRAAVQLPADVNPWSTADVVISSIDLVKRPEARRALDAVPIDILVVDEAHHVTPGTERGALVADLAARSTWIVLATATPHSGDANAFAFLSTLGGSAVPTMYFRRQPEQLTTRPPRRVHFHSVSASAEEGALLDATLAYATALWRNRRDADRGAAVIASLICRRAASSGRALRRTLARRRLLLAARETPPLPHPQLPWLEDEQADDVGPDAMLTAAALPDAATELTWLERLIGMADACRTSSKFSTLRRLLRRVSEPAIVFSEYRDTLIHLAEWLGDQFTIAMLHGGLSGRQRRQATARFVNGEAQVLLASDAAGEGLNLQTRCRFVVNLELPWNPVRLEQRIGRVDRLGQRRRVHAVHLYHRGFFEDGVLRRLRHRIVQAQQALGESQLDDIDIAAALFDQAPLPAVAKPAGPFRGPSAGAALERMLVRRRSGLLSREAAGARRHFVGCAGLARSHRRVIGMALVFELAIHDELGRVVARHVVGLEVMFSRARRVRPGEVSPLTRRVASSAAVREALARSEREFLGQARLDTAKTANAVEPRLQSIEASLNWPRPRLYQGSLFDRRAEQRVRVLRAANDRLRAHVAHQRLVLGAIRTLSWEGPPRLAAAWLLGEE